MPNIPSSVAQTPAKKRKLSSVPQQPIQNNRDEQLSNEQAVVEPSIGDLSAPESISNGSGDHLNIDRLNSEDFSNFFWCLDIIFSTYYH